MPSLFTDEAAGRVSQATRWVEGQYAKNNYRQRKRRPGVGGSASGLGLTLTAITSFDDVNNIAGQGQLQPYDLNQNTGVIEPSGNVVTVYNLYESIEPARFIYTDTDAQNNVWVEPITADEADLVRTFSNTGGANPGDIAQPVANCVYDATIIEIVTAAQPGGSVFGPQFSSQFGNLKVNWCTEPYTETLPIWVAKISPDAGPIHHHEEFIALRAMDSFTPDGFTPRPLYVVKPVEPGTGTTAAGMYRATADADFSGADGTYAATITAIIQPGNAGIGNTVTVQNDYHEAGSAGAEIILVEWFDDPALKYLPLNVERTSKNKYIEGVDNTQTGIVRWPLVLDWSYHEDLSPGEMWDNLALTSSTVIEGDGAGNYNGVELWTVQKGDPVSLGITTETVVVGINWNDGAGNIVVSRQLHTVLNADALPPLTEPTDECPP